MPESNLLLPKFLTKGVVESAIVAAVDMAFRAVPVKRRMLHVAVLVPEMDIISRPWPDFPIKPHCIAQMSFGDKSEWPHPFDEVARCKAVQAWHGRSGDGTDVMPHLLFPSDTLFWGAIKRYGIAVGTSGLQPWYDRMISGVVIETCVARAYGAKMEWAEKNSGADFV